MNSRLTAEAAQMAGQGRKRAACSRSWQRAGIRSSKPRQTVTGDEPVDRVTQGRGTSSPARPTIRQTPPRSSMARERACSAHGGPPLHPGRRMRVQPAGLLPPGQRGVGLALERSEFQPGVPIPSEKPRPRNRCRARTLRHRTQPSPRSGDPTRGVWLLEACHVHCWRRVPIAFRTGESSLAAQPTRRTLQRVWLARAALWRRVGIVLMVVATGDAHGVEPEASRTDRSARGGVRRGINGWPGRASRKACDIAGGAFIERAFATTSGRRSASAHVRPAIFGASLEPADNGAQSREARESICLPWPPSRPEYRRPRRYGANGHNHATHPWSIEDFAKLSEFTTGGAGTSPSTRRDTWS